MGRYRRRGVRAMKRASDRKSVYLRVRITKGERALLRKLADGGESLSDTARRLLFSVSKQERTSP